MERSSRMNSRMYSRMYKIRNVFKNGPSKICGRQPLKNLKGYGLPKQTYSFKFFMGFLPPILLGPFLNALYHMHHRKKNHCTVKFQCENKRLTLTA